MGRIGILLSRLVTATTIVGAVAIILMIFQVTIDVFLINIFRYSIPGSSVVVSNYYMAAIAFLPVALAEKLDQHISVDLIYNMLPPKIQKLNLLAVRILVASATAGAAFGFLLDAIHKYKSNSFVLELDVKVADWPGYFMLPIGFGLWSLIVIYKIVISFTGHENVLSKKTETGLGNT